MEDNVKARAKLKVKSIHSSPLTHSVSNAIVEAVRLIRHDLPSVSQC